MVLTEDSSVFKDVCHRETVVDLRGTYLTDHRYCSSWDTCPALGVVDSIRQSDSSTYTNYCSKIPDKCPASPGGRQSPFWHFLFLN